MSEETCHPRKSAEEAPPLFQHGDVVFQAYHVGWIVCAFFTIIATVTSFWLINKHLQWYTNKREQRHIVRLLFMVPLYSVVSLCSYLFWNQATPLILIRDGYESIVLASFFYLLLFYVSNDPDEQRLVFLKCGLSQEADRAAIKKGEEPSKWVFPLGFIKSKPSDGLYFLQLMKWAILQYSVLRPLTTLIAVILEYAGWYCELSWSPKWGHVYIITIVSLSVTVAMYCLIQLYVPVASRIAHHKPLLKLFSIKAVVFLTFWQATFLSVLSMFGVVKDSEYMTAEEINIGFGALLQTFEMMLFAFLHIRAFSYKPYRPPHPLSSEDPPRKRTPRLRSLGHAMDFRETFRELWQGCIYMSDKMRGREPRFDHNARRAAYLEGAFGVTRPSGLPSKVASNEDNEKNAIDDPRDMERAERQWLGYADDTEYRLAPVVREKSEDFEMQIERELQRRGIDSLVRPRGHIGLREENNASRVPNHHKQRSWWRNIYTRVSQSNSDDVEGGRLTPAPSKRRTKSRSKAQRPSRSRDITRDHAPLLSPAEYNLEEPPPQSIIRTYRKQDRHDVRPHDEEERAPLSGYTEHHNSQQAGYIGSPPQTPHHQYSPAIPVSPTRPVMTPSMPSADSLLVRVFPSGEDFESSVGHLPSSGESAQSSFNGPVPRARLTPANPTLLTHERGYNIGVVGQGGGSLMASHPARSVHAEVVERDTGPSQPHFERQNIHNQELFASPPPSSLPPPGNAWYSQYIPPIPYMYSPSPPPRELRSPPASPSSPVSPGGLRRTHAHRYVPDNAPRPSRRVIPTIPAPLAPAAAVSPPPHSHVDRSRPNASRRPRNHDSHDGASNLPRSNTRALHSPLRTPNNARRVSQDIPDLGSTLTQPSYSNTPAASRYPVYEFGNDLAGRRSLDAIRYSYTGMPFTSDRTDHPELPRGPQAVYMLPPSNRSRS